MPSDRRVITRAAPWKEKRFIMRSCMFTVGVAVLALSGLEPGSTQAAPLSATGAAIHHQDPLIEYVQRRGARVGGRAAGRSAGRTMARRGGVAGRGVAGRGFAARGVAGRGVYARTGVGRPAARAGRVAGRSAGRAATRTVVRRGAWVRPGRYWWGPGGAVAAGAAIGVVAAGTAVAWAGAAPGPGMCWYYTDSTRRQGFWDVCP